MSEVELRAARRALREHGEVPERVLGELRRVVGASVGLGALPAVLSPYGRWNVEAEDDVYQGWLAERLLKQGALQSLLDRSRSGAAFRRMAERSLRQWLLNSRERTEAQNLYARVARMLQEEQRFVCVQRSERLADCWWALTEHARAGCFGDGEERLLALGFSLGEFDVVRFRADAAKLSPVLSTEELMRFVTALLAAAGAGVSLGLIATTLRRRFALDAPGVQSLEESVEQADLRLGVAEGVVLREAARAVIAELSARQCAVLAGTAAGQTLQEMAGAHGCSPATISNEQQRIAVAIGRYADGASERDELLRIVRDLVYEGGSGS